jgi:hypothetical protein
MGHRWLRPVISIPAKLPAGNRPQNSETGMTITIKNWPRGRLRDLDGRGERSARSIKSPLLSESR